MSPETDDTKPLETAEAATGDRRRRQPRPVADLRGAAARRRRRGGRGPVRAPSPSRRRRPGPAPSPAPDDKPERVGARRLRRRPRPRHDPQAPWLLTRTPTTPTTSSGSPSRRSPSGSRCSSARRSSSPRPRSRSRPSRWPAAPRSARPAGVFVVTALFIFLLRRSPSPGTTTSSTTWCWGFMITTGMLLVLAALAGLGSLEALQEGRAADAEHGDRRGQADPRDRPVGEEVAMAIRTPEEIKASIEANRAELGTSLERLRSEVAVATDWRQHIRNNQRNVVIGAAVAGLRDRRRRGRRRRAVPPPLAAQPSPSSERGTPPTPSRPGPTWVPMTGPISETKAGSQPKIARQRDDELGRLSGAWTCWTTQPSAPPRSAGARSRPCARTRAWTCARARSARSPRQGQDRLDLQRRAEVGLARRRSGRRGAGTPACRRRTTSPARRGACSARARTASGSPPALAAAAAARTISPSPPQPLRESSTLTRSPPLSARRAARAPAAADSTVPEIPPARWIETMSRPASSSGSQTARNSPIEGWLVVGSVRMSRRPGVVGVEVDDVALEQVLAVSVHVQGDLLDSVARDEVGGKVVTRCRSPPRWTAWRAT